MVQDKSLYYYGRPFHWMFNGLNRPQREQVIALVPENTSVLDIGCGTGELSLALHARKGCQVVGVDLSRRMLDFAQSRNPYPEVTFLHRDATAIPDFADGHFDVGILCMVFHELPPAIRPQVLAELNRLSRQMILLDYEAPLPNNITARTIRLIERVIGSDHFGPFKSYLAAGGLLSYLAEANLDGQIAARILMNNGCHQVIRLDTSLSQTYAESSQSNTP